MICFAWVGMRPSWYALALAEFPIDLVHNVNNSGSSALIPGTSARSLAVLVPHGPLRLRFPPTSLRSMFHIFIFFSNFPFFFSNLDENFKFSSKPTSVIGGKGLFSNECLFQKGPARMARR